MASTSRFDQDLRDFLEPQGGMLVMLCDDPLFVRALRTAIFKTLAVKTDCLQIHQDPAQAMKSVHAYLARKTPVLVLADRLMRGRPTLSFLRDVKTTFTEARLLVMTQETTKDELSQLYEIGVDSILTKPVSIDTLVEKMAGAIKPQGKISQLVQEGKKLLEAGATKKVMQMVRLSVRGVRHSMRLSAPGWTRKRSPGPHSSRRPNWVKANVPPVTYSSEKRSEFSRSRQQPAVFSSSPANTTWSAHSAAGTSSVA